MKSLTTLPLLFPLLLLPLLAPLPHRLHAAPAPTLHQQRLPFTTTRIVAPTDLLATYTLLADRNATTAITRGCPANITHTGVTETAEGVYTVAHKEIMHNGVACTSSGAMTVVDEGSVGEMGSVKVPIEVVGSEGGDLEYLQGVETGKSRVCGKTRIARGSVVVFVQDKRHVKVGTGLPVLRPGLSYMVITGLNCVYVRGKAVEGAAEEVATPTPEEDPVASETPVDEGEEDDMDEELTPNPNVSSFGDLSNVPESEQADDGHSCFPADAKVVTEAGMKTMANLQIGDRVLVASGKFSPVFMFTHRQKDGEHAFLRIDTASNRTITLTHGHYLYVDGHLAAAKAVSVGSLLELADGQQTMVVSISQVRAQGLYNPQTLHGDIVVDSLRASTYTTAVEPRIAHKLLSPLRTLFKVVGGDPSMGLLNNGADSLSGWLPRGRSMYRL